MSEMPMLPCSHLLLDACCTISLYHSGHMQDILATAAQQVAIARFVLDHEISSIDVQPLIEAGELGVVEVSSEAEELLVVNLAARLDDGEAYTGAIAIQRNWAMATDDTKAINLFSRREPPLHVLTTPDLVRHWVETKGVQEVTVRAALQTIAADAHYRPRQSHYLAPWWDEHTEERR